MFYSRVSLCRGSFIAVAMFLIASCSVVQQRAKSDYTVEVANMEFVYVLGGTFQMGSTDWPEEQPVHSVTINDLLVGTYEVTFEQYDQYCSATPQCELPSDEEWGRGARPVINVSWHDAKNYAAWLSEQTDLEFMLPSEAEWEYFARAGTSTKFWTGDTFPANAANCRNCGKSSPESTVTVGKFSPNPWRLSDTTGNVREWVMDDYLKDYTETPTDGSPATMPESRHKAVRGGAWNDNLNDSTPSSRDYSQPKKASPYIGFRLVLKPNDNIPVSISK